MTRLSFETSLRSAIVAAAQALNHGDTSFSTFERAYCNERFWIRTPQGGFQIRPDVTPAEGISNIFIEGRKYGFECATAMVIVLYKAVLDSIDENEFNRLFANILLYDWHYDSDLRLIEAQGSKQSVPGDIMYFKNPEVSPLTPEWKGENVVKLDEDFYFGHGVGIGSSEYVIRTLNSRRWPGSIVSAYLTDQVIHPDFNYLSRFAYGYNLNADTVPQQIETHERAVMAAVGRRQYIRY
ncbi:protein-glutamine gamma-glutamyltransferase [Paenibacillus sp. P96]|uniref:Protein-glutamine gamma-glutamyltransferase n=1 Tax=Paenibacillus zeirhizosphaerae TaxID=2987519 RepID=A0ABT9FMC4_9BACL|nr:protein-glutamine gamma-glutamyltransferase [Paenibacillus sp. P96]MDP4095875.1 protein-glutamine gamma-glutamyltransferase [Paenibacillus sp. P96]